MAVVLTHCYACDRFIPNARLIPVNARQFRLNGNGQNDDAKREIATSRRRDLGLPLIPIGNNTSVCFPCNLSIQQERTRLATDPGCVRLNIIRGIGRDFCVVCHSNQNIHRLTLESRVKVFPIKIVICLKEFVDELQYVNRPCVFKDTELLPFLQGLRTVNSPKSSFEDQSNFTDEEFDVLAPMTKAQFALMYSFCDPVPLPNSTKRRHVKKKDLLALLCKLRQGLSDIFLKVILGYSSRQAASLAVATARQSANSGFVPRYIGLSAIDRQTFVDNHVTDFANALYNPTPEIRRAIVYFNGTYIDILKSTNFQEQRESFSVQKGKNLVKPVMVVGSNGYILTIQGPFFSDSKNNDPELLRHEIENGDPNLMDWFQEGDIFLLDRGYRDIVPLLEALGVRCLMPNLLPRNQRQFTTEEANQSRLITFTRWIVEARNGHIQSMFKFFANQVQILHVPHLADFLNIAGAIVNAFHPAILVQGANADLATEVFEKLHTVNVVQARVEEERLKTRNGAWQRLEAEDVADFPVLPRTYLKDLTLGVFQVNLAPSYIQDKLHRENEDEFQLDTLIDEPGFIRVRIFSRFRQASRHQIFIAYDPSEDGEIFKGPPPEPILGYYCTCRSGARTLGTCAHVTSVLWFLGYARHEDNVHYPSSLLLDSVLDAGGRHPPAGAP